MKYILTLLVFIFASTFALAQKTIQTQFLVIGTTAAGFGAGIQAAKAGINTLIIDSTAILGTDVEQIDTTFTFGLDGRFLRERRTGKTSQQVLGQWLQDCKQLKLLTGVRVSWAVKRSTGWEIKLSNGQRIL